MIGPAVARQPSCAARKGCHARTQGLKPPLSKWTELLFAAPSTASASDTSVGMEIACPPKLFVLPLGGRKCLRIARQQPYPRAALQYHGPSPGRNRLTHP